jgi:hypothetical protein
VSAARCCACGQEIGAVHWYLPGGVYCHVCGPREDKKTAPLIAENEVAEIGADDPLDEG